MTRRRFATALPLLLLAGSLGALPRPGAAQAKGKTELGVVADIYRVRSTPTAYLIGRDHKLVGCVQGNRGWHESPTRELIDYLLKAPAR